jgi:hypothetical protein
MDYHSTIRKNEIIDGTGDYVEWDKASSRNNIACSHSFMQPRPKILMMILMIMEHE